MAENHVGMEQIGKMVDEGQGFNVKDLEMIRNKMESLGITSTIIDLSRNAYILVIKNPLPILLDDEEANIKMFNEQLKLNFDKKAFMYGRVVNKHARWNLCYDFESRDPDYENGKGTIVGYDKIPLTKKLLDNFPDFFGEKARDLKGEGNYYYDTSKTGIGFHGDSERRKVVALRLGDSLDLHYQWFFKGKPEGDRIIVPLDGGDIYVMNEKAVGTDWKKKNIYTLRHATGSTKFTSI
jgi:hypothetical protein